MKIFYQILENVLRKEIKLNNKYLKKKKFLVEGLKNSKLFYNGKAMQN